MPFNFAAPIGSASSSMMAKRLKIPAINIVLVSGVLQIIGFTLLASLPESSNIPTRMYGFQLIAGFGWGINISTTLLIVLFVVKTIDKGRLLNILDMIETDGVAVGMAAVSQLRIMGGAIVLAIATSVFNSYTRPALEEALQSIHFTGKTISSVQSLNKLSFQDQQKVKSVLAHGYNLQMWVLCAFAIAQILTTLLLWRRKQTMV